MLAEERTIRELCGSGLDAQMLGKVTAQRRARVPFDSCTWLIYDPDVLLPTAAVDIGEPVSGELRLRHCANEQLEDDVHKFRDLAARVTPVGVLNRSHPAPLLRREAGMVLLDSSFSGRIVADTPASEAANVDTGLISGCTWSP